MNILGLFDGISCGQIALNRTHVKYGIGISNAPKIQSCNDNGWRRLTPLECERLQTVPNNYMNVVSDTQKYKLLGNAWTVDVIVHIFGGIKNIE